MLDSAKYTPRLRQQYRDVIRPTLKEEFGYTNDMQLPAVPRRSVIPRKPSRLRKI
jgi:large subunit ribosomal protein L5